MAHILDISTLHLELWMIAARGSARAAGVQAGARETGLWPRALQICRAAGLEICRKPSPRQPCPRRPQGEAPRAKAPHARAPCAVLPRGHPLVSTPVLCLVEGCQPHFGASCQQGQQHSGHPSPKPPLLAPRVFGLCLWSRPRRALNAQPNAPGLLKSRLSRSLGASISWVMPI